MKGLRDRINYVFSILEDEPDFTINDELVFDRKDADWFTDVTQMDSYWSKKIKNAILNLKILGKEWDNNKEL